MVSLICNPGESSSRVLLEKPFARMCLPSHTPLSCLMNNGVCWQLWAPLTDIELVQHLGDGVTTLKAGQSWLSNSVNVGEAS